MKKLFDACKPRESVFDETRQEDTLDLSNLLDDSIDAQQFYEETYVTEGIKLVIDTAFERFERKSSGGLLKLTQQMGGGKTHALIALGLLAKDKDLRKTVMDGKYAGFDGDVRLVAFSGRETYLEYGLWGEIANQLGKKEVFKDYYSPLMTPGQSAWIKLLRSDTPTLILLDELPPYLQNAKTISVGAGNLADMTTTALANLFNAVGKAELKNVCIVVSDLKATYEEGSQLLQHSFKELEGEIERFAINIEPVGSNTDDLYHILRSQLFEKVGDRKVIDEIAIGYKKAVGDARQMGHTNYLPDEVAKGIYASYPFHPSIRDLFARFKENPNFQQTRDYIRLTRAMVRQLYSGDMKAKQRYLVNAYDMNLNESNLLTKVKSIKPKLSNAIAHDIANGGNSVAENIDEEFRCNDMQDLSKLLLVSSLPNISGALLGLSMQELVGYMAEPGRDITSLKTAMESYRVRAWYLYKDKEDRMYFKDVKNVNAEMLDMVSTYTREVAKQKIKELLKEKLAPNLGDCYQDVLVFPSIEEISLKRDSVTLILTEPDSNAQGLSEDVKKFYEEQTYKNRVMFLSGQRNSMLTLIDIAKQYKAIESILNRMKYEEKLSESDPQYQQAQDIFNRIQLHMLHTARETFVTLYYPRKDTLGKEDIKMEFTENKYDLEEQIRNELLKIMKFQKITDMNEFRKMVEGKLFTQRQMQWKTVLERAASISSWVWYDSREMKALKEDALRKKVWEESGDYIDKEPPPPITSLTVREAYRDDETGEVTLRIAPLHGDTVHYEINDVATAGSDTVRDLTSFKTKELKLSFLCVDSGGTNETGDAVYWVNDVSVKHRMYSKDGGSWIELKATANNVTIKYTCDGSNPRESGGVYEEPFAIPTGTQYVQAVAVNEKLDIASDIVQIKVNEPDVVEIDKRLPLTLKLPIRSTSTTETFALLDSLNKYELSLKGVMVEINEKTGSMSPGFIELNMGDFQVDNPESVANEINSLVDVFFREKSHEINATINEVCFKDGSIFEQWVSDKKETIEKYKEHIKQ